MFYDEESADEPIPWWYNSVTGESTWDCPTALTAAAASSTSAAGVNEDEPKAQHMELAIVETVNNSTWTQLWSEEYQVLATRGFIVQRYGGCSPSTTHVYHNETCPRQKACSNK